MSLSASQLCSTCSKVHRSQRCDALQIPSWLCIISLRIRLWGFSRCSWQPGMRAAHCAPHMATPAGPLVSSRPADEAWRQLLAGDMKISVQELLLPANSGLLREVSLSGLLWLRIPQTAAAAAGKTKYSCS